MGTLGNHSIDPRTGMGSDRQTSCFRWCSRDVVYRPTLRTVTAEDGYPTDPAWMKTLRIGCWMKKQYCGCSGSFGQLVGGIAVPIAVKKMSKNWNP